MSLDVTLSINEEIVFDKNITHNLSVMAQKSDLYKPLWTPIDLGCVFAKDVKPFLIDGLSKLLSKTEEENRKYEPSNGWGTYENLVQFVVEYINHCSFYPDSIIEVCK